MRWKPMQTLAWMLLVLLAGSVLSYCAVVGWQYFYVRPALMCTDVGGYWDGENARCMFLRCRGLLGERRSLADAGFECELEWSRLSEM